MSWEVRDEMASPHTPMHFLDSCKDGALFMGEISLLVANVVFLVRK